MLERAKACLNSRARGTAQCVPSGLRSRKRLHSTFWSHGAGDLELPPYMLSTQSPPWTLPLGHRQVQPPITRNQEVAKPTSTIGRPCLDFLYPPQTLAYLHQASTCSHKTFERFEGRRVKRPPDGPAKASRRHIAQYTRYSDRTHAQKDHKKIVSFINYLQDDHAAIKRAEERRSEKIQRGMESAQKAKDLVRELNTLRANGKLSSLRLLGLMSRSREHLPSMPTKPAMMLVDRAWHVYDELTPQERDDERLKGEFICWLALAGVRSRRCIELYDATPRSARTLETYRAVLLLFVRKKLWPRAVQLHKEVLKSLAAVSEAVTVDFFRAAVKGERWHLAMHIEAQHRILNSDVQRDMFWVHVSDTPYLLKRSLKLNLYLTSLERASTANDGIRAFCASFFKEGLRQEFMAQDQRDKKLSYRFTGWLLPLRSIHRLTERMIVLGPGQDAFLERLMVSMVQHADRFGGASRIHTLVHLIHVSLKRRSHRLSQETMDSLLRHYCEAQGSRERPSANSMTIDKLVAEYEALHGTVSRDGLGALLRQCAYEGLDEDLHRWMKYFRKHYPGFHNIQPYLWTKVYVYAQRANQIKALEAFSEVELESKQRGENADVKSHNSLIKALARVDDLEAAVEVLSTMARNKVQPDTYTYHPIMEMMATRGDTSGVLNFITEIEAQKPDTRPMEISYFGSLLVAYMAQGNTEEANEILRRAIDGVKDHTVRGSLTHMFRRLMYSYARARDVVSVRELFEEMEFQRVKPDPGVYGALISLFCHFRHSPAAYKVLRKIMPQAGVFPTADEYAHVMRGFNNQQMFDAALRAHARMQIENIRPSIETRAAYIRAKAGAEAQRLVVEGTQDGQPARAQARMPLRETIDEIRELIQLDHGREVANSSTLVAAWPRGIDDVSGAYFQHLIYVHGTRECFDAVKELVELYIDFVKRQSRHALKLTPPFRMLAALMAAHLRARNHDEVARCWTTARDLADKITANVKPDVVPTILRLQNLPEEGSSSQTGRLESKTSPARTTYLELPLRQYMASLAEQRRVKDMLELVPELIARGYMLQNDSWNRLIRFLCSRDPPFALVAFVLNERFLMQGFKAWGLRLRNQVVIQQRNTPRPGALVSGMQYLHGRYLAPAERAPQYSTMVLLARALIRLRELRAVGADRKGKDLTRHPELQRYIGTPTDIYDGAPKTMEALRKMPVIPTDKMQMKELPGWNPALE